MFYNILLQVALLGATGVFIDGQIIGPPGDPNGPGGPGQSIEILADSSQRGNAGEGIVIQDSIANIPYFYKSLKKICINGPWVFYNAADYGMGRGEAKSVIAQSVSGSSPSNCLSGTLIESVLASTGSIRALGKKPVELYPLANFLAERENDILNDANNLPVDGDLSRYPIGSLVINDPTRKYILCGKKSRNCICVDKNKNSPLIVNNVGTFPEENPFEILRRVQPVKVGAGTALEAECDSLPAPTK